MKITPQLKSWCVTNAGLAADASDEAVTTKSIECLTKGTLTAEKLAELTSEVPAENPALKAIGDLINKAVAPLNDKIAALESKSTTSTGGDTKPQNDVKPQSDSAEVFAEAFTKSLKTVFGGNSNPGRPADSIDPDKVTPIKLFGSAVNDDVSREGVIRVKGVTEEFSHTKTKAYYPENSKHVLLRGQPVRIGDREIDRPSDFEKAVCGAWFKYMLHSSTPGGFGIPTALQLTDLDQRLVKYAMYEMKFSGVVRGNPDGTGGMVLGGTKMTDYSRKALLDDTTSGGLEANPIVFDDALILTPLLNGEFAPLVNMIDLARGRRVEGLSMANPVITDGYSEGTEVPLLSTSGFIAGFDTNIYDAVGAMEIGMFLEEDSPVNLADQIIARYGEQYLAYLDKVICVGNGTTQPLGFLNASGTSAPNATNSSGPHYLADYEALLFGVSKAYRQQGDRARQVFASNETSYMRSRKMKVDPAASSTDERRLLGNDYESFMTLGHPHKISEYIGNAVVAYVNLRYFRMYRRQGMQVRIETGGKELARKNQRLIVVRARFGGQLELGGACAIIDDMQS